MIKIRVSLYLFFSLTTAYSFAQKDTIGIIVYGQSNATSWVFPGGVNPPNYPYVVDKEIITAGVSYFTRPTSFYRMQDTIVSPLYYMGPSNSNGDLGEGGGVLGCEIGKNIKNHSKTAFIINHAIPSMNLDFCSPQGQNRYHLNTQYGSLIYRLKHSDALQYKIKGLVWWQGEADGHEESVKTYAKRLEFLIKSFKEDIPSLEHFYIIQIHTTGYCSGKSQSELRDIQASFDGLIINNVKIKTIASFGALQWKDQCHFDVEGYTEVSRRINLAINQDLFKDGIYEQPLLLEIKFIKDKGIELVYNTPVYENLALGIAKERLADYFYTSDDNNPVSGISFNWEGDSSRLLLHLLDASKCPHDITYLPNAEYKNKPGIIYKGPFIWGRRDSIPALSFYKKVIKCNAGYNRLAWIGIIVGGIVIFLLIVMRMRRKDRVLFTYFF